MTRAWDELREPFRRIVFKRSVREVANEIPADRKTVYRLVSGETERPSRAIRESVERLVEEERADDYRNA